MDTRTLIIQSLETARDELQQKIGSLNTVIDMYKREMISEQTVGQMIGGFPDWMKGFGIKDTPSLVTKQETPPSGYYWDYEQKRYMRIVNQDKNNP